MRLYFLRHGQAGNREDWDRPDEERPLTRRGIAETHDAARGMRWLDLGIEHVLSSPLVRAQQTALIVAHELHLEVTTTPALASGCTLTTAAEAIGAHLDGLRASSTPAPGNEAPARTPRGLLLVGHEPDFSVIIGAMIGRKGSAGIRLKKGALCRVDFNPDVDGWRWAAANLRGSGTLVWLLTAKQLGRLAC
jgi:phosphohistidine phosphatase